MFRRVSVAAAILSGALGASAFAGQEWQPASRNAAAITGDLTLEADSIRFQNGTKIRLIEVQGTFPGLWGAAGGEVEAHVYRLQYPSNPKLRAGNRLCGGTIIWIALSNNQDGSLNLDAFNSGPMPVSSKTACASYVYAR